MLQPPSKPQVIREKVATQMWGWPYRSILVVGFRVRARVRERKGNSPSPSPPREEKALGAVVKKIDRPRMLVALVVRVSSCVSLIEQRGGYFSHERNVSISSPTLSFRWPWSVDYSAA